MASKVKTYLGGRTDSVDYKANKPALSAPVIVDEITDDEGNQQYVLVNGNTIPKIRYDAIWNPPKGVVMPEHPVRRPSADPRAVPTENRYTKTKRR